MRQVERELLLLRHCFLELREGGALREPLLNLLAKLHKLVKLADILLELDPLVIPAVDNLVLYVIPARHKTLDLQVPQLLA